MFSTDRTLLRTITSQSFINHSPHKTIDSLEIIKLCIIKMPAFICNLKQSSIKTEITRPALGGDLLVCTVQHSVLQPSCETSYNILLLQLGHYLAGGH